MPNETFLNLYMTEAADVLLQVGDYVKIREFDNTLSMFQVTGLQRTKGPKDKGEGIRGKTNAVAVGRNCPNFVMTLGNAFGGSKWAYGTQLVEHYRMIDIHHSL